MAELIEWMLTLGKNPEKVEGYSRDTTRLTIYKLDKYHRWVWNQVTDGYTLQFEHSHADDYMYELATSDEFKQSWRACRSVHMVWAG